MSTPPSPATRTSWPTAITTSPASCATPATRRRAPAFESALRIYDRLAHEHPGVARYSSGLAACRNNFANLLRASGDAAGAPGLRGGRAGQERLTASTPTPPNTRKPWRGPATTWGTSSSTPATVPPRAREFEAARAALERLAREHPDVARYRSDLAQGQDNLGNVLRVLGDAPGAPGDRGGHRSARASGARAPVSAEYQSGLALSRHNLGVVLRASGDPAGARAYEAALAIRERWPGNSPGRRSTPVASAQRSTTCRPSTWTRVGSNRPATGSARRSSGRRRRFLRPQRARPTASCWPTTSRTCAWPPWA
ncbi:MAG: tetratricopeptide repeat protein [Isosphaeraceae bacterium]